jgi:putative membrane protein
MRHNLWRLLAAASLSAPILMACGTKDDAAAADSAAGTVATADSTATMNATPAGAMDASVASFIDNVNQAEVEAGTLASTKARNADVKAFAKEMVDAHQKAMTELRDLGTRNQWMLPDSTGGSLSSVVSQMQQMHRTSMDQLRAASGAQFDKAYIDSQVTGHQQVLDVLNQQAASLQNGDLRSKVAEIQKDVETHLKRAQEIAQKLGS